METLLIIIILVCAIVLATRITIVPESYQYVIEKRGHYKTIWNPGFHFRMPFETVRDKYPMHEVSIILPPGRAITKDDIEITADAFIFYNIYDPRISSYNIGDVRASLNAIYAATLRDIIGKMELEQCLTDLDTINQEMTKTLDRTSDKWGIKVNRIEIKSFTPKRNIKKEVEHQMKANHS